MIRAFVLTISESSFAGAREDRSGPALRKRCEELGWVCESVEIIADDRAAIAARLRELCDILRVSLVITSGGTGVARRDVTPEAARDVLEKEIPGFGELMRAEGLKSTLLAPLSRGLAGCRGQTLIVCLPGSPKAAVESLDAIVKLVPHVLDLLEGRTGH